MKEFQTKHWLFYAMGGGMGHLTRALSLGRLAAKKGHQVSIVTDSPFALSLICSSRQPSAQENRIKASRPSFTRLEACEIISIDPFLEKEALFPVMNEIFAKVAPEVVVVDTFALGWAGELPACWGGVRNAKKILVQRDVARWYWRQKEVADFTRNYDLIIYPGESPDTQAPQASVTTAPFLIRNHAEIKSREEVNERPFHIDKGDFLLPLISVVSCGPSREIRSLISLATKLFHLFRGKARVQFMTPAFTDDSIGAHALSSCWPFLEKIRGTDLVIGSGGYNTVYECRSTQTPLLAYARKRRYDRQDKRLRPEEQVVTKSHVIERIQDWLTTFGPREDMPAYINGAVQAYESIQTL